MKKLGASHKLLFVILVLFAFSSLVSCDNDDDDDDNDNIAPAIDDDANDDDANDDADDDANDDVDDDVDDDADDDVNDDADDDVNDDVDDDYDDITPPEVNPDARADAFKLFYRERAERVLLSLNRFGLAGNSVFGTAINKYYIAKSGNEYEVVAGPNDNNPIGLTVFGAWNLYKAIGGRTLELTLIRLFEGLWFSEQVSGHSGLTNREALPGWTRVMDGVNDTITRTRMGDPITPPYVYDAALEQEILDAFYDGVIYTYRENPEEYYFHFKARNELPEFAISFVFDELPDYLRISNCCSSWMISKLGDWQGAFWGNHNSRDNFTDYALGYLAAFEAENTEGLPDDLAQAAQRAADAARRVGDAIVGAGMIQMTVDEHHDYNTLVPGGEVRPDGATEWQDLGSLSSCQMAYTAQAISSEGLSYPVPQVPLPGAIETSALKYLFDILGLPIPVPVSYCYTMDDAFVGIGWGELLDLEVFGIPIWDITALLSELYPGLFYDLLGSMMDDFKELVLGAVNLCFYARIQGDEELYFHAQQTLNHLVQLTRILGDLVYGIARDDALRAQAEAELGADAIADTIASTEEFYYLAALYARMFDIDSPMEHFGGFGIGQTKTNWIESQLDHADTTYTALLTDEEIREMIVNKLATKESWIQDRFYERFGPEDSFLAAVRRAGDGYECLAPGGENDNWMPTENTRHWWFGDINLFREALLCDNEPHTLDCTWAALGCAPADLDDSGAVDAADQTLFDAAWTTYGENASCAQPDWCDGADLDQSGTLDADDQGYMAAAQGCTTM